MEQPRWKVEITTENESKKSCFIECSNSTLAIRDALKWYTMRESKFELKNNPIVSVNVSIASEIHCASWVNQ